MNLTSAALSGFAGGPALSFFLLVLMFAAGGTGAVGAGLYEPSLLLTQLALSAQSCRPHERKLLHRSMK